MRAISRACLTIRNTTEGYRVPIASPTAHLNNRPQGPCARKNKSREDLMAHRISRRKMLAGTAALAGASAFPMPSIAQNAPFKLGLLTVKTGPLAQGGIQMEQGVLVYLKQTNNMMGGRKVDFISADTGG